MRTRCFVVLLLALGACGDDSSSSPPDAGTPPIDATVTDIDASCFADPQTHAEILNGCVEWQHVNKTPVTPLLSSDGTLPPLPP